MKYAIDKGRKDEIQRTENLIGNSRIGTFLLAVIKLVNSGNNAGYKEISDNLFTIDDSNKSAKLNYYIKLLGERGLKIVYFDSSDKRHEKLFRPIEKDKEGKYFYKEQELIDLFVWVAYFLNYKYSDEDYKQIFNDEVKKSVLNYVINFSNEVKWEYHDRYSLSEIFMGMEEDLIVLYYENLLNKDKVSQKLTPSLERWAEQLIKDCINPKTKKINNNFVR